MTRKTTSPQTVTFRASEVLRRRIDELAVEYGGNRTKAIHAAVLKAGNAAATGEIPDENEVLALLGESARAGNVTAMKELRTYHRERNGHQDAQTPFESFDELAERRTQRA